jgi:hypothetical protein
MPSCPNGFFAHKWRAQSSTSALRSFVLVAFLEAKRHQQPQVRRRLRAAAGGRCCLLLCHRCYYCLLLLLLLQLLLLLLPAIAARIRHESVSKRSYSARFVPSGWGDLMLLQRRRRAEQKME